LTIACSSAEVTRLGDQAYRSCRLGRIHPHSEQHGGPPRRWVARRRGCTGPAVVRESTSSGTIRPKAPALGAESPPRAPAFPEACPMAAIAADRDLLFGLLALQNGLIDQAQLVAAFQAWTRNKARPLAEHLAALGALDADQRAGVEAMVALHLKKHGGS